MIVLILERVSPSLRGDLTRWLLEPRTGVFVGQVSAMVRERRWERACKQMRDGAGMMAHSTDTEQGFALRIWGDTSRLIEDFDGLSLIRIPAKRAAAEPVLVTE